jgi:hypothetical protein
MVQFTKVISTAINDLLRYIKVQRFGLEDIQEPNESAPFGDDANPIKGMTAIYAATSQRGESVIIGYINKNRLADTGEKRIFSTDSDGELSTYIWLKNDGTMEIGGSTKNLVRFQELETGFNQLRMDLNTLVTTFNSHTHLYIPPLVPAPITPIPTAPALPIGVASTANISGAKINEIKTL